MKAEELMVKDWVQDKKDGYYYQMESLWALVNAENFDPIPITSEILEKNGIVLECSNIYVWKNEKVNGSIECNEYISPDHYFAFHINNWQLESMEIIGDFIHIHELQHALRLCKIDKEIVL